MTFDTIYNRILEATGTKTQVELAKILKVKQSSISDAKRRNTVPDGWLITLLERYGLDPRWIKFGDNHRYIAEPVTTYNESQRLEVLRKAVCHFGAERQQLKAAEEYAEASAAISRNSGGFGSLDELAGELADTQIMQEQLFIIYPGLNVLVDDAVKKALKRLEMMVMHP